MVGAALSAEKLPETQSLGRRRKLERFSISPINALSVFYFNPILRELE
jgi:hypothetical protein